MICNPEGHIIINYAWGLGSMTNNEVVAYSLFEGIILAHSIGVQKITINGDSMMVIRAFFQRILHEVMYNIA
jgi:ribonuclease HI